MLKTSFYWYLLIANFALLLKTRQFYMHLLKWTMQYKKQSCPSCIYWRYHLSKWLRSVLKKSYNVRVRYSFMGEMNGGGLNSYVLHWMYKHKRLQIHLKIWLSSSDFLNHGHWKSKAAVKESSHLNTSTIIYLDLIKLTPNFVLETLLSCVVNMKFLLSTSILLSIPFQVWIMIFKKKILPWLSCVEKIFSEELTVPILKNKLIFRALTRYLTM